MNDIELHPGFEAAQAEWEAILNDELGRQRDLGGWHLRLRDRAFELNRHGIVPDDELREWLEWADAAYSSHCDDQIPRNR